MAERDRHERQENHPAALPIKPKGHGKQPAHGGVEPMKGSEPDQDEPRPERGQEAPAGSTLKRRLRSRIAVGIRRSSRHLQPNLMRPVALRPFDEELRIELNAAAGIDIELHHPAVDSLRIELRIDRAVKRVGEIDAFAVAADLHHLRPAVERSVRRGMRPPARRSRRSAPCR